MPCPARLHLVLLIGLTALAVQACGAARPTAQPTLPAPTEFTTPALVTPAIAPAQTQSGSHLPTAVASPPLVATPLPPAVSITAVGGDLAIRSGPDLVFDAVAVLPAGKSLPVYARSIQDGWLQVPIPSQRGVNGWISTKTGFSQVDGYILDLPLISTVEWPFGGYIVNCTAHQLLAKPGDKPLPSVNGPASNRVWFYPGLYTIYDPDVSGQPQVTQVKLFEHTTVSVISDGNGMKYACP